MSKVHDFSVWVLSHLDTYCVATPAGSACLKMEVSYYPKKTKNSVCKWSDFGLQVIINYIQVSWFVALLIIDLLIDGWSK